MTHHFLAALIFASGVHWDVEERESREPKPSLESSALPSHLSGYFDLGHVDVVNLNTVHNRLSHFEPLRLSLQGFSWTSNEFHLDGTRMWHPFDDGQPTVLISAHRFAGVSLYRRHGQLPVFQFESRNANNRSEFVSELTFPITGTTLLPHGFMDREPALPTETPRRQERLGYRVALIEEAQDELWDATVGLELNDSRRVFPTLLAADDALLVEAATSAQGDIRLEHRASGISMHVLASQERRPNAGAEYRYPKFATFERAQNRMQLVLNSGRDEPYRWGIGFGYADTKRSSDFMGTPQRDIAAEWAYLKRRSPLSDDSGGSLTGHWSLVHKAGIGDGKATLELGHRTWRRDFSQSVGGAWDLSGWERGDDFQSISVSLVESGRSARASQSYLRLGEEVRIPMSLDSSLWLSTGVTAQWAQPLKPQSWLGLGFEGRLEWRYEFGSGIQLSTGLGTVPQMASTSLLEFLDTRSPSGHRYRWDDLNGDRLFDPDERGAQRESFGGRSHEHNLSNWLPHHLTWTLSVKDHQPDGWFWGWQGLVNILAGRVSTYYDEETLAQFSALEVVDPGGDGLGESGSVVPGGRALRVYNRNGDFGDEFYELRHAARYAQYWGMSLDFGQFSPSSAFQWKVSATAYLSLAETPFGIFADRNDVGVVGEFSADPNAQINSMGRSDACRAFGVNIDLRYNVSDALTWYFNGRYRDGEPFTRILIVDDLAQGPTAVMAVERGNPVPRFTFHMTLDSALDWYVGKAFGRLWFVNARITNLLNSGTELLEDSRTEPTFRRSLEMVPTRTGWIGIRVGE